ncbi:Sodium-coupled monocarboxylate transporter 1 [Frankliniella fusca]|uniref:Sodium-coupled monocarboxylate transporter 1 n=1 Tax=Frankliniella fusca TaxID=407009 RepID=A0AAE1GSI6_9NEOP|nr:Sodium-coupled monocarboxylate transporter 1 [Frankliniella fusca]
MDVDVEGEAAATLRFGALDYSSFIVMMLLSALVGIYYGFFKKQDSVEAYFLGGRSMGVFPIAMSLIASNISGVSVLVVPSDMYTYGAQISLVAVLGIPIVFIVVKFFLPTFYELQYESSYEFLYMPIVMYVPCLAFHQVSGVNVQIINPVTCLGGLRAVVWTDALQLVSLVLASVVTIVVTLPQTGGLSGVWERAAAGGRLEVFNMDTSPYIRATFWNVVFGEGLYFLNSLGVAPSSVQRYLAMPTLGTAKKQTVPHSDNLVPHFIMDVTKDYPGLSGIFIAGVFSASLRSVRGKALSSANHQVACHWGLYLREILCNVSLLVFSLILFLGLPALSEAERRDEIRSDSYAPFCSTVSSILNTLAGTVYKDFIEGRLPKKPTERQAAIYLKLLTLVQGIAIVFLIFVIEQLGSILEVALSLTGMTTGASFGLFLLGLFVPWAESTGALTGALASLSTMAVLSLGNLHAKKTKRLRYPTLPTRTDGCNATLPWPAGSTPAPTSVPVLPTLPSLVEWDEDLSPVFRLSPFVFILIGVAITVVVGMAVSATVRGLRAMRGEKGGFEDLPPPELLSPPVARAVRRRMGAAAAARSRERDQDVEMYQAVPLKADGDKTQAG